VNNSAAKPVIGILGGVGSGKSTVAAELAKLGCAVIDADKIAHELLERADVKEKVKGLFGKAVLDSGGKIDRRKLAETAFAGADKLAALNQLIHPLVLSQTEKLIERYKQENRVRAIILDMPLLMEVGWEKRCDKLIFVDCKPHLRAKRAEKAGICSENELKIRENFQISLDKKAAIADNIVDNNSGFSVLTGQVAEIFSNMCNG
jgi:dephospho-CoA kinase